MGLTLNTAVSMFVRQSIRDGSFPFRPTVAPAKDAEAAVTEAKAAAPKKA